MQSGNREIAFCEFSGIYRGPTLFRARSGCRNSRISAAEAMSSADNFLQKQPKQRERGVKNGRGGYPARPGSLHFLPEIR
jgi:hypothetical protein